MRLLEETEIDIPEEMVREELSFGGDEESEPGDRTWSDAEARVRLLLILGEIARRDGIEIDDRDIEERIARIAESRGTDVSSMKSFMLRGGGLSRLSAFILAERTLDYLIDMTGK
jgi:FKBP-type peptidyl-prolyl cis-trans isomerase (trigger factor)